MTNILLADDHAVVRRGVRALLEAHGGFLICGEASNGREAVELAAQHQPAIVVLDISLPVLNGIDATRQIHKSTPGTEILIFTMHDSEETIREALRAGARGCLLKSEADQQIVPAVQALVRHRPFLSPQIADLLFDTIAGQRGLNSNHSPLTPREREIVQLIAEGYSNKKIAKITGISVKTVETHRAVSMRKLKVHSTAELVRYAVRNKLIQA
ncbi:MAG: response regulator transcription factor [Bradyrhizobiaceae bacterium]|nr:response regulator transcription factor [Bradyrhizobiaceae bacterium]